MEILWRTNFCSTNFVRMTFLHRIHIEKFLLEQNLLDQMSLLKFVIITYKGHLEERYIKQMPFRTNDKGQMPFRKNNF
jgi:hypothetical protein